MHLQPLGWYAACQRDLKLTGRCHVTTKALLRKERADRCAGKSLGGKDQLKVVAVGSEGCSQPAGAGAHVVLSDDVGRRPKLTG